jgi:hypothetical protein
MTDNKEKSKKPLHAFVSYAKEDKALVDELLKGLEAQHPDLLISSSDQLSAGENWLLRIKKTLSKSNIFIVLLSPNSITSELVLSLLGAAWALNIPIIPIVTQQEITNKLPLTLANVPIIDIKKMSTPEAVSKVIERYEAQAA